MPPCYVHRQLRNHRFAVHLLLERLRVFRRDLGFYILQNRENVKNKVPSSNSKVLEQEVFRKWIFSDLDSLVQGYVSKVAHDSFV